MREGSRDDGVSGPIYRPEGSWAKLLVLGGGRSGLGRLAWRGGVAARGRVPARGGAKEQARWPWRAPSGPLGRGRAVDEVHRRRTGERQQSREGRGK